MLTLQTVVALIAISGTGQTELLEFSAEWCGPCRQMQPVVDALAAQGHPVRKLDFDRDRAMATRFGVTSIPCFIMVVDGKEVDRVVGATSQPRLEQMLRLGANAAQSSPANSAPQRLAAPAAMPRGPGMRGQSPDRGVPPTFAADTNAAALPIPGQLTSEPLVTADPTILQGPHRQSIAQASATLEQNQQTADRCLASSVRLRIEDAGGNSVGSGTIVDSRSGEVLVLTCGHIFRESKGNGQIFVDLFGAGAPKHLPGQLIGYDLQRDVGLVSFHCDSPVVVARLAPASYVVERGAAVISVGCDNGREPSARMSHVTNTDKFLPPPNIQVAGQPVEGRSGGGLFSADGLVIGVCNAADPADNEGLYAGVGSVYAELQRKGLTEMIVGKAAAEPPMMLGAMPAAHAQGANPRVIPTSADGALGGQMSSAAPAAVDAATIEKLRAASGDAEVICIVRPRSNPHAMSEVVVVDHASPDFMRQLSTEGRVKKAAPAAAGIRPTAPSPAGPLLTSDRRQSAAGVR